MKKGIRRGLIAGGALLAIAAPAFCSCSSNETGAGGASVAGSPNSQSAVSSSASSATVGVTHAAASSGTGGSNCNTGPVPSVLPPGWIPYTDWSCECPLYIPSSKEYLPKPIQWTACPESPNGIDCRMMVVDWSKDFAPIAVVLSPWMDRNPDGTAVIAMQRNITSSPGVFMDVVADADGPVRSAIARVRNPNETNATNLGCHAWAATMSEGYVALNIVGADTDGDIFTTQDKGGIGGPIDELHPKVLAHFLNDETYEWFPGAKRVTYGSTPSETDYVLPWDAGAADDGGSATLIASEATDPDGLPMQAFTVSGDAVFWQAVALAIGGINIWTPDKGTRPFIRWPGDFTKFAADFGTDGKDMVWTYGTKQTPNDPSFTFSVMTAPFTTDPAAVQSRRLRSFAGPPGVNTWSVGCGYAANSSAGTLLVRLADGVSWQLPYTNLTKPLDPIGITCDELFVLGHYGAQDNIARIKIASLGPGTPPD